MTYATPLFQATCTPRKFGVLCSMAEAFSPPADAPGYGEDAAEGPVCWKCRGSGCRWDKKQRDWGDEPCGICSGNGRLPPRQRMTKKQQALGRVTTRPAHLLADRKSTRLN